jgi:hypothetical protein
MPFLREVSMAILWIMEWTGLTPEQYEQLRTCIDWEGNVPDGLHHHAAGYDGRSVMISEVWESPDHVQPFMDERFLPAVRALNISSMPKVDLFESLALFTPPA